MSNVLNGKRILVLEDDALIAADLLQGLEALGAEVSGPYARVADAYARLEAGVPIEGAILDIHVGGELSYSLVDRLRAGGVPVVFATGTPEAEIPADYRDVPRYPKPYRVEAVARGFAAGPDTGRDEPLTG